MAVLQTTGSAPSAARVSHALNGILAVVLAVMGLAAAGYRLSLAEPSSGQPYAVIATACGVLLLFTAVAEVGFHTAHRWARAATCVAWLGAWPVFFIGFTLMIVDGAAATMAFATCIGACSLGVTAVGEDALPRG
ncbi:hypothetical protein [Solicola gregarius]|uniref:Uncharacterized protein n=1 Tax=Solicola gregarius TaxID=2908642 RepID=A0AA46YKV2_9ACTN|nr:hypothetical protein [Solicola gregarius]UYM04886.1 hypothetical protein L0C25_20535 [Solicola gregarius]